MPTQGQQRRAATSWNCTHFTKLTVLELEQAQFACLISLFLSTRNAIFSLDTKVSPLLLQCVFGFSKLVGM